MSDADAALLLPSLRDVADLTVVRLDIEAMLVLASVTVADLTAITKSIEEVIEVDLRWPLLLGR